MNGTISLNISAVASSVFGVISAQTVNSLSSVPIVVQSLSSLGAIYDGIGNSNFTWNSTYTTLNANSAAWINNNNSYTIVQSSSAIWNNVSTVVETNSANWISTYTTLNSNSAAWLGDNGAYTIVQTSSGNWNSVYSNVNANSATAISTYTTVNTNSAAWVSDNSSSTTLAANSANWNNTTTTVNANSANWSGSFTSPLSGDVTGLQGTTSVKAISGRTISPSALSALAIPVNTSGGFTTNTYPPSGSVVILIGESLASGYPIVSLNGSNQQNGYTGPGYCWAQWLSLQPGFITIPVITYGVSGAKSGDAAGTLAGNSNHGTYYLSGTAIGAIGSITAPPSAYISATGNTYWGSTYDGINDYTNSTTVGTYSANQMVTWNTMRSYGHNPVIIGFTSVGSSIYASKEHTDSYNSWTRSSLGAASGIDILVDVTPTFQNNLDTNYYHTDQGHLISRGCYYYALDVYNAIIGQPIIRNLATLNPGYISTTTTNITVPLGKYITLGTTGVARRGVQLYGDGTATSSGANTGYEIGIGTGVSVYDMQFYVTTAAWTWNSGGYQSANSNQNMSLVSGLLTLPMSTGGLSAAGGIRGTTTNDNAAAGNIGQIALSAIPAGSAVSLTTATTINITSLPLPAGDWDVEGNVNFSGSTATVTGGQAGLTSTSATLPTDGTECYDGTITTLLSDTSTITLPRKRFSLSTATTIYLVAQKIFSAGTVSAYGSMTARRIR